MIPVSDTNILVRFVIGDDVEQEALAQKVFEQPKVIIPTVAFCELAWVLSYTYKCTHSSIAQAIRGLLKMKNVVAKIDEVQAGLRMLDDGGDFADGVIAYAGSSMASSATVFTSFDKKAIRKLSAQGIPSSIPS